MKTSHFFTFSSRKNLPLLAGCSLPLFLFVSACSGEPGKIRVFIPSSGGATLDESGGTGSGGATAVGGTGNGGTPATGGQGPGSGGMPPGIGGTLIATGGTIETAECAGSFPADEVSAAAHHVKVEGNVSWGELPHFWDTFGTGRFGLYLREESQNHFGETWSQALRAATTDGVTNLGMKRIRSHGLLHDDMGIYTEQDGQPVYNFDKFDQIFDFLVEENGIVPIMELAPMPSALASDPSKTVFDWGMGISPPKDYALWQDLIQNLVQHSVDRYGMDVVSQWDWEVWNEPECCSNKFWSGELEEYFILFERSAAGVRAVIPDARVGGPVTSQPYELRNNSRAGERFLEFLSLPETTTDLGFFAMHTWSFVGGAVDGYFEALNLLDEFGFTDTRIAVTEFGPTWQFNLVDEPQEMSQGASFVAQVFSDLSRRTAQENKRKPIAYSWWVLSDVFEEEKYREDEPLIGCMGLISREGIKKPAYNAYKFLAQMGHQQLALVAEGAPGVNGMAALDDGGGIQVIVYNGQNPGAGPSDGTYYTETGPAEIGITLTNLDPNVSYDVREYRIDDTHGNVYKMWQDMGRPKMADLTEADWQSFRDNMESPEESVGDALCGSTLSKTVSLPSPGVYFLTLTPSFVELP